MLQQLDALLRRILLDGVAALGTPPADPAQVAFVPPDAAWRAATGAASKPRLSVHLLELRENVKLRSNDRVEEQAGGALISRRAPLRVDCHYLISAFALAETSYGDPPLPHALLEQATAALAVHRPLVPGRVHPPGSTELAAWPEAWRDVELPVSLNPAEGFHKAAEFWGTLEGEHPWQPFVYLVVTVPVDLDEARRVERVRRMVTTYRPGVSTETLVEIGGVVLDRSGAPVPRAWVIAQDAVGELARTTAGDDGRYQLALPPQATRLFAAAFGLGRSPPLSLVPDPSDYTLQFH
jgi:hypothetical protein